MRETHRNKLARKEVNTNQMSTKLILLAAVCVLAARVAGAKKSRQAPVKCQQDECHLKSQHFALYSNLKQALDSDFDLNGKEVIPLIRSVEVLERRFNQQNDDDDDAQQQQQLNGTQLVKTLLGSEKLVNAMRVFRSDEARWLINLYGSSVNGRGKNLACSQWRVDELELAARRLKDSDNLDSVFSKMHKNFLKRSAKKCLKHSCSSIDENMSQIDSVIGKRAPQRSSHQVTHDQLMEQLNRVDEDNGSNGSNGSNNTEVVEPLDEAEREFAREELELCKFFKRTNEPNCQISGRLLSQLKLNASSIVDHLNDYKLDGKEPAKGGASILANCRSMRPLLTLNLAGLRWYTSNEAIEARKLSSRTFWCPSLSYWLEMDRLCSELEPILSRATNSAPAAGQNNVTFAY